MSGTVRPDRIIQFGAFELDPHTGELRKFGTRIKLQQQPLQILQILLEQPGEVVTREALKSRLWPGGVYVDFENAINSSVRKLRDALGDTAENPRFVETLSRRGYRFIAPVGKGGAAEPVLAPEAADSASNHSSATARRETVPRVRWALWTLAVVVAAACLIGAALAFRIERQPLRTEFRAVPLTAYPGAEIEPAFSPDGTRVVFAWNGPREDNFDVYVKLIGAGDPFRLTTDAAADRSPAWSPDGRWIAFLREVDERVSAVMLAPAMGGAEVELTRVGIAWIHVWAVPGRYLAWAADGKSLFTIDGATSNLSAAYKVVNVSIDSREKRVVATSPERTMGAGALAVSPDGQSLAFTRTTAYRPRELYLAALSSGSNSGEIKVDIPNGPADRPCALDWTRDGKHIVFSTCGGGMWRQPLSGREKPLLLAGIAPESRDLAISRNGQRLVYSQGGDDENIWRLDVNEGNAAAASRFISSTRSETTMAFSPGGDRIAFESDRSGSEEIWVCNRDGSSPAQLTTFGSGWSGSPHWSPDGRTIAFDRSDAGRPFGIYVIPAQGGKAVGLVTGNSNNFAPSWSQDGQWIYFTSNQTDREEVWKVRSEGGLPVQVTSNGGGLAQESPDGSELYYKKEMLVGPLWKRPVHGGKESKVLDSVYQRNYAVTPKGIYYIDQGGKAAQLRYFDFGSRRHRTLQTLYARCPGFSASPDYSSLLFARVDVVASDLMLVEDFR
jgi:Tol biopolymer transport system component/DNA-binding winged helix-turn-helix (wHTH) protein